MVKIENLANTQKIQTNSPKKANKSNEKNEEVREQQQEFISSEASNAYKIYGQQLLSNESDVQEPDVQEPDVQETNQEPTTQEIITDLITDFMKNENYNFINSEDTKNDYIDKIVKIQEEPEYYNKLFQQATSEEERLNVTSVLSYCMQNCAMENSDEIIGKMLDELDNITDQSKTKYLKDIAKAASNTYDLSEKTINTLLNNIEKINDNNKAEYLCNIAKAASNTYDLSEKTINTLLNNIKNIKENNKIEYLCNIAKAASNTDDLSEETIKTLLGNIKNIKENNKIEYLCNIAKAASNTDKLSEETIKTLLGNIEKINDDDNKAEYLCNITKAASNTKDLSKETILSLSEAATNTNNITNDTIDYLIDIFNTFANENKEILENIIKATNKTTTFNFSTKKRLIELSEYLEIDQEIINTINLICKCDNPQDFIQATPINKSEYTEEELNQYINILDSLDKSKINGECINHLAKIAAKTKNISEETINKLLKFSSPEQLTSSNKKTYLYNLSLNPNNNKKAIELLFNKALEYEMFEDKTSPYIQRTFVRNLIDAISRLDQNEAKELYIKLYDTATTPKDNTNPVKENDGKNDIDGFSSENLSNNAQSSYMPPKLILFFAKLDKTLGYQQNTEIQNKLMDAITNTSLDEKENKIKLAPKVPLCPALNYLQKNDLAEIKEDDVVSRIMQEDGAKDIQQFELEYLIDLKLSHGLYKLNTDDGQNKFIEILTDNYNYDILTNKFEPKMASETKKKTSETQTIQLPGDISDSDDKIEENVNMDDISSDDKNYDGVYNLALIALKQMEPEYRKGFLNKLIQKLNPKKQQTIKLLEELKTNEQFDNDKLLATRPVLRQYNEKGKTVSKNYQPNLTSFRMPRTTDKCEAWIDDKDGTQYLGFKDTSYKIKTELDTKTAELLFGSQSSSGHQMIGDCWLISELKKIEATPNAKLFIYSHFNAKVENDELASVTITLKNGNKVTFEKDVVDKVSKIGATEHLSPAMSCLALLTAISKKATDEKKHGINDINKIFQDNNNEITTDNNKKITKITINNDSKILSSNFGKDNPILNAFRISNEAGNHSFIFNLFLDDYDLTQYKEKNIMKKMEEKLAPNQKKYSKALKRNKDIEFNDNPTETINQYKTLAVKKHAINSYGDFQLNPQNSHSLFVYNVNKQRVNTEIGRNETIAVNEIIAIGTYNLPSIDENTHTYVLNPKSSGSTGFISSFKKLATNMLDRTIGFFRKDKTNTKTNLSVNG